MIIYGIGCEHLPGKKKGGSFVILPRRIKRLYKIEPKEKESNGPFPVFLQLTATDFTTAVSDLREIFHTVGHGEDRYSDFPGSMKQLLVNPNIMYITVGGANDVNSLYLLSGLMSCHGGRGNGRDAMGCS